MRNIATSFVMAWGVTFIGGLVVIACFYGIVALAVWLSEVVPDWCERWGTNRVCLIAFAVATGLISALLTILRACNGN